MGSSLISIDGSVLEGGGQIIRNSFSIASLLGKNIQIANVRAGREQPGLKRQHLCGIELVNRLYQGRLDGANLGSQNIKYQPFELNQKKGQYVVDTGTAGSITLLIQISLPCLIFSIHPTALILKGGTNVIQSPQIDYLVEIFKPAAQKFGIDFSLFIEQRGFYPKGGGKVKILVDVVKELNPINILERGKVVQIESRAFVAGSVPLTVAKRINESAKKTLRKLLGGLDLDYQMLEINETEHSFGEGAWVIIIARTDTGCVFAGSEVGQIGVSSEIVGEKAAISLSNDLLQGGAVDEFLQDQLIIFMALAKGISKIKVGELSLHTQTSIHFTQLLTGAKFVVEETKKEEHILPTEKSHIITCEGIGYTNKYELQKDPAYLETLEKEEDISIAKGGKFSHRSKGESSGSKSVNNNNSNNEQKSAKEKGKGKGKERR